MKTRLSIIAILLIIATLLPSCAGGVPEETTETIVPDTTPELTEPITDEVTTSEAEPEIETRLMQKPYIDIEFTEDGGFYDAMEHVDCTLDDEKKGSVVNDMLSINGKEYKIPHLYVKQKGGVGRLTYNGINEKQELYDLLAGGFTMEAFLVNGNSFNSSSDEQCLTSSTQSGGYNFTVYKFCSFFFCGILYKCTILQSHSSELYDIMPVYWRFLFFIHNEYKVTIFM